MGGVGVGVYAAEGGGFCEDYLAFKPQPRLISSIYPQCFDCLSFCLYGVDVAG